MLFLFLLNLAAGVLNLGWESGHPENLTIGAFNAAIAVVLFYRMAWA